jgi:UDP:flavonoid glycosyltransferase YjiC (YdhE family)
MIALGSALVARGHTVCLQTWTKWAGDVEAAGMTFVPAPEYQVFPTDEQPLRPYEAAVRAAHETVPQIEHFGADAVVSDILTVGPALAGAAAKAPCATLIPHVFPHHAPGMPAYSTGARLPRTPIGRKLWRTLDPLVDGALERGRDDYNDSRSRLGLEPLPYVHTGLSRSLTLVGTLPQLEYPRDWPGWTRVVGPLMWEPKGEKVEPPPGDGPVVLIAPSTAQDASRSLLRAALEGLADEPVRVIATWNGPPPETGLPPVPDNAVLVPWLSYGKTMPACDVAVIHGGHGTLVRALTLGCAVVVCPATGDMPENAARADWSGAGVRMPRRLTTPRTLRLAVRRALSDRRIRGRVQEIAAWSAAHDGPQTAAAELETWLAAGPPPGP